MKKNAVAFVLCVVLCVASAWTDLSQAAEDSDVKQEVTDLKSRVTHLEQKIESDENPANRLLQSTLSGLQLGGGISAGFFHASNPGKDTSGSEFLLSNFLVQLSSKDTDLPVGFVGAFGETSTPSLLSAPENNSHFDIEYASLTLKPITDVSLEVGLLQPNAGFENTYTFYNKNIILGSVASQQPYNAYGARVDYDIKGFQLLVGYYKKRLNQNEYSVDGITPDETWEIGVRGSVLNNTFSIYHYHPKSVRNLTGVFVERTIKNIYLAINIDYWNWDDKMKNFYGSKSSIGGAVYIDPRFGHFSIPLRLEYIHQGESRIYIDNLETKHIYAAAITPTYKFHKKSYVRVETAYVYADQGFSDKNGNSKNSRVWLAAEIGYLF